MNKSLIDFQDTWSRLVDKASDDYTSLTPQERVWFNVQILLQDVDNGGLISHYYNSGANHIFETIEDLCTLGEKDTIEILETINSLFPNHEILNNQDERNKVINAWEDGIHDEFLKNLDEKFYQNKKELEKKLVEYIITNNL